MADEISLTIDGRIIQVTAGTTIHKAAQQAGIIIPTICYHDFCTANALCRICVVEVEGSRTLVPSCIAKARDGMKVTTQTERVRQARKTILEMLVATVDLSEADDIHGYMMEYGVNPARFPDAERREPPTVDDNPMFVRDYAKCILCWRCVQVCAEDAQFTFAINFSGRGFETQISTFFEIPLLESTCVFCGQCVGVCPTAALKPKREYMLEQGYTPDEIMSLTRSKRRQQARR
jgi:NADP-reducing hydrogenase subunit HndD